MTKFYPLLYFIVNKLKISNRTKNSLNFFMHFFFSSFPSMDINQITEKQKKKKNTSISIKIRVKEEEEKKRNKKKEKKDRETKQQITSFNSKNARSRDHFLRQRRNFWIGLNDATKSLI